ncbi:hypothetical protein OPQ81_002391 [Rhizoctonia solani]|nr:hypothetical protein OPQ81_002391 [Rhizoctonia solani]
MILPPLAAIPLAASCAWALAVEQAPFGFGQHPISSRYSGGVEITATVNGVFEHVTTTSLPNYRMRVRQSRSLCDPTVKQYSGYLDVSNDKHLFFWFFESRKSPREAPLSAWMNGGPGGSSALGLLMENGPCNIVSNNATARNPYAWNEVANIFYLDQPAGVGYSYSTSDHLVGTTWEAAKDFYAFVQLFLKRFPQYSERPFHVLSESYGGQYAPHFANYINRQNKANRALANPNYQHINLESVLIVNGMVSPTNPSRNRPRMLRSRIPRLRQLFEQCKDFGTPLACIPAAIFMSEAINEGFGNTGLNRYDVRKPCTEEVECYDQMGYAQAYLNSSNVKVALGVPVDYNYSWLSWDINSAFVRSADIVHDASPMIHELLEDGVRVLNLAGDADAACNFIGAFEWMYRLDSKYAKEFRLLNNTVWKLNGKPVGEVRASADEGGKTAGNFTWLRVYEAGHMVPHDQPEVALELFKKWVNNKPLAE